MTRSGNRDVSERKSRIGEDERQPEIVRLAARQRRSNLVILVTLRKANHAGKTSIKRDPRSFIQKRERGAL